MNLRLQKNSVGYYFMNFKTYNCGNKYNYLIFSNGWGYTPFLNRYEKTKKVKIKELVLILHFKRL
jgi:hypothetical protein